MMLDDVSYVGSRCLAALAVRLVGCDGRRWSLDHVHYLSLACTENRVSNASYLFDRALDTLL